MVKEKSVHFEPLQLKDEIVQTEPVLIMDKSAHTELTQVYNSQVEDSVATVEETLHGVDADQVEDVVVPVDDTLVTLHGVDEGQCVTEDVPQQECDSVKVVQGTITSERPDEGAGSRMVRRSVCASCKFINCQFGSEGNVLESLRRRYSVDIFKDDVKKIVHVKGCHNDVVAWYTALKALLAEWRAQERVP